MAVILVVEDNKNTQLLTATRLKPYFEVVCADDGLDALDVFYSRHVDLVISDIMMPNMDGFELLQRIRSEGFNTPVLLLTAKVAMQDKREGFNLGTDESFHADNGRNSARGYYISAHAPQFRHLSISVFKNIFNKN